MYIILESSIGTVNLQGNKNWLLHNKTGNAWTQLHWKTKGQQFGTMPRATRRWCLNTEQCAGARLISKQTKHQAQALLSLPPRELSLTKISAEES